MTSSYVAITPQQGARFFGAPDNGPVVMLNLLRFRERADYSHAPDLEPVGGVSGAEAYTHYVADMTPLLEASGGSVLFSGASSHFLIGPEAEHWDHVLLVRQASKASFLTFASDPESQRITAHRTAAVCDSRLLPITPD